MEIDSDFFGIDIGMAITKKYTEKCAEDDLLDCISISETLMQS